MTANKSTDQRAICEGCKRDIDPTHCWCGSPMDGHGMYDGHSPVEMGCVCGYEDDKREEAEAAYLETHPPGSACTSGCGYCGRCT